MTDVSTKRYASGEQVHYSHFLGLYRGKFKLFTVNPPFTYIVFQDR